MSVADDFEKLDEPPASGDRTYTALEVRPGLRVGKSTSGGAAVLASGSGDARAPIVTRHIRVDFGARCRVLDANGQPSDLEVTIIECTSNDRTLVRHFLLAVTAVLGDREPPDNVDIRSSIDVLVEAFRAMSATPLTSVQGLWGELFVINGAADASILVDSWHATPHDRHDFAYGLARLEVKTVGGRHRRHRFSHEQLSEEGADIVIASLQLESAANGITVQDLLESIVRRPEIDGERRLRLLGAVAGALGEEWAGAERQRYDAGAALRSLRYFDRGDIPRISAAVPDAVTDVRYTVDLAAVPHVDPSDLRQRGDLFAAVIPSRRAAGR